MVKYANAFTENNSRRLAEAVIQVLLSANEAVFDRVKGEIGMTLMEFMKPEVDKYAESRIRENDIKHVKAMIKHGDDNEYIKLIMDMTDSEIDKLRRSM